MHAYLQGVLFKLLRNENNYFHVNMVIIKFIRGSSMSP